MTRNFNSPSLSLYIYIYCILWWKEEIIIRRYKKGVQLWKGWNNDNDSDSDLNGDVFRREEVRLRGGIEKAELVVVVTDRNRRRNRGRRGRKRREGAKVSAAKRRRSRSTSGN